MNKGAKLLKHVQGVMQTERWPDAIKLLKQHMAAVEKDCDLSWNFAWCHLKLGRLRQARTHMVRAAKLAPNDYKCKFGLGTIYNELKQFKKAETNCVAALRIKESYIVRLNLALAYMAQGKLTEAESVHLEAIKLKPKQSKRYKAYADFLSDVGREEDAEMAYQQAGRLRRIN